MEGGNLYIQNSTNKTDRICVSPIHYSPLSIH